MSYANNEKRGKTNNGRNKTVKSRKNQKENETNKYLGILEVNTIKQVEMKEKIKRSISDERENFSKLSSAAAI